MNKDELEDRPPKEFQVEDPEFEVNIDSGEKRLLVEVLLRAYSDAIGRCCIASESEQRGRTQIQSSAKAWFLSRSFAPFSFNWICEALDLTPQFVKFLRESWKDEDEGGVPQGLRKTFRIDQRS